MLRAPTEKADLANAEPIIAVPTEPAFKDYAALQVEGTYPSAISFEGIQISVLRATVVPQCGEQKPWVSDYVFLVVEASLQNNSSSMLPWKFSLYDDVVNQYVERSLIDATQCLVGASQPPPYVMPGNGAVGAIVFEMPLTVVLNRPHIQWKSQELLLIADVFLNREAILFDPALQVPVVSP